MNCFRSTAEPAQIGGAATFAGRRWIYPPTPSPSPSVNL